MLLKIHHLWGDILMVHPIWKNGWFFKKNRNHDSRTKRIALTKRGDNQTTTYYPVVPKLIHNTRQCNDAKLYPNLVFHVMWIDAEQNMMNHKLSVFFPKRCGTVEIINQIVCLTTLILNKRTWTPMTIITILAPMKLYNLMIVSCQIPRTFGNCGGMEYKNTKNGKMQHNFYEVLLE